MVGKGRVGMIEIKVIVKGTNELRWTEHHPTEERAQEELRHMKENHFNPEYFRFEVRELNEVFKEVEEEKEVISSTEPEVVDTISRLMNNVEVAALSEKDKFDSDFIEDVNDRIKSIDSALSALKTELRYHKLNE